MAIAVVIIIIVGALGGAFALGAFSTNQESSWLFKGAYVTYSGTTRVLLTPVNVTLKFQILDFNSTKVEILTYYSVAGQSNQSTDWSAYTPNRPSHSAGQTFVSESTTTRLINGKTYYNLIADKYTLGNSTTTYYYISSSASFPVERVSVSGLFTIDLVVTSTNIPGIT